MEVSARSPGPDVVRAVAMLGVILVNYHGYLILRGGDPGSGSVADFFEPFNGPLATRFAATFVLVAGVGVTLMTNRARGDRDQTRKMRWRLSSRGVFLYAVGVVFDNIWPGTILPYYGAMFVIAAFLFTLRSRWVIAVGVAAALAGWTIRWWRYERELDGSDTSWLTRPSSTSIRGLVFDVFVNGTHPLLPWLAFLCAGIVLGRMLPLAWWRPLAVGAGFTMYAVATMVASATTSERATVLLSARPYSRSVLYVMSALGTALIAFAAISWLAERYEHTTAVDVLRRAGQLSLTIYVVHALVFNLVVDWLEWVEPGGIETALVFTAFVWIAAVAAAVVWQRRYGRGPVEQLYRGLTV